MNKRSATLAALCLALLLIGAWAAHRIAFDWHSLRIQLRSVAWLHVAIAVACIYIGFWFRAVRWAVLLGPSKQVASSTLVAPQFIGFGAVALFGRLADLARPYLIARRTGAADRHTGGCLFCRAHLRPSRRRHHLLRHPRPRPPRPRAPRSLRPSRHPLPRRHARASPRSPSPSGSQETASPPTPHGSSIRSPQDSPPSSPPASSTSAPAWTRSPRSANSSPRSAFPW